MSRSSSGGFALGAAATAALAGLALSVIVRGAALPRSEWAAAGFASMALPLIASGWWLARQHGRAGASFLIVVCAGLGLRAALLAVVVAGAARQGPDALAGALFGLGLGFVPVTGFELLWFARNSTSGSSHARQRP